MNDDTRLRHGLMPCEDLQAAGPLGTAAAGGSPRRPEDRAGDRKGNRGLCRARPRHQQLPAPDRLSVRRRLSRGRFLFADHPARRGRFRDRLHQRGGDRTRHCRALDLPRQDPDPEGPPPAPDRDRGLPRGFQCRLFSRPGRGRNRHPARSDRPRDRGVACGDRLLAAARSQRPRRDPVRYRRRLDRAGPDRARSGRKKSGTAHQSLDVDSARRRHAGGTFWRPRRDEGVLRADGRGSGRPYRAVRRRAWPATSTACTCSAPRAR